MCMHINNADVYIFLSAKGQCCFQAKKAPPLSFIEEEYVQHCLPALQARTDEKESITLCHKHDMHINPTVPPSSQSYLSGRTQLPLKKSDENSKCFMSGP